MDIYIHKHIRCRSWLVLFVFLWFSYQKIHPLSTSVVETIWVWNQQGDVWQVDPFLSQTETLLNIQLRYSQILDLDVDDSGNLYFVEGGGYGLSGVGF